jgi:hypothetical protein
MNGSQFDTLTQMLTKSRRSLLGGTLALAAGWIGVSTTVAKKKRKRKRKPKKPKPNVFGCLEVGQACKNADQCCSGICEGKNGKRTCRAHDTGVCRQEDPGICRADSPTGGSNVCGGAFGLPGQGGSECADCRKDADCLVLGFPAGTACVPMEGNCAQQCGLTTACVVPCPSNPMNTVDQRSAALGSDDGRGMPHRHSARGDTEWTLLDLMTSFAG